MTQPCPNNAPESINPPKTPWPDLSCINEGCSDRSIILLFVDLPLHRRTARVQRSLPLELVKDHDGNTEAVWIGLLTNSGLLNVGKVVGGAADIGGAMDDDADGGIPFKL